MADVAPQWNRTSGNAIVGLDPLVVDEQGMWISASRLQPWQVPQPVQDHGEVIVSADVTPTASSWLHISPISTMPHAQPQQQEAQDMSWTQHDDGTQQQVVQQTMPTQEPLQQARMQAQNMQYMMTTQPQREKAMSFAPLMGQVTQQELQSGMQPLEWQDTPFRPMMHPELGPPGLAPIDDMSVWPSQHRDLSRLAMTPTILGLGQTTPQIVLQGGKPAVFDMTAQDTPPEGHSFQSFENSYPTINTLPEEAQSPGDSKVTPMPKQKHRKQMSNSSSTST